MNKKLLVPDIGDFEKVEVIEILVKKGDKVSVNDPVITIESDKSSVEIPSTLEGKIESINVKIGDKVSKDDLVLTVNVENENSDQKKESQAKENIPKDTESIINQAEKTLIAEKENIDVPDVPIKIAEEKNNLANSAGDIDPVETKEWIESLSSVLENDGSKRAQFLIKQLIEHSYKQGSDLVLSRNTPYINTIPPEKEVKSTGDQNIERKIRSLIRWNAAAMVVRANKKFPELGGHIGCLLYTSPSPRDPE